MINKETLLGELMFESVEDTRRILNEKVMTREIRSFAFNQPNSVTVVMLNGETVTIGPA